jgi:PhnB protein
MGADIPKGQEYNPGNTISISLSGDNEAELRSYYDKLVVGGQVIEPMEKAPWGDTFGMLKDRQGIEWMVNVRGSQA